jgi:hypothetical protein
MIHIKKAEVEITEQTLHEILAAVEKAKEELAPFCNTPLPDGDMTVESYNRERAKRGFVLVSSPNCGTSYRVDINDGQESSGYKAQI